MDTQEFELSDDELSFKELDAVSGGACDAQDLIDAMFGGRLIKAWVQQGCPVK